MSRFVLPSILLLAFNGFTSAAPVPSAEQKLVADVNKAIEKGVQFLRTQRNARTQWEGFTLRFVGKEGGATGLATLALLNCGLKPDDKDVASALEYLRALPPDQTYVVALTILALAEAKQAQDLPRIQKLVDWLLKTAIRSDKGLKGWSYPPEPEPKPGSSTDASNTQYALLGLYAGKQAGAKIPEAMWKDIQTLYLKTMVNVSPELAGWKYIPEHPLSFPMTAAGVSGLVIAGMGLDTDEQQLNPLTGVAAACGKYESSEPIRKGLNWIGQQFTFENAPRSLSTYYNIYGIERVGRLSGHRFLGKADWYREGCEYLTREQSREGRWLKEGKNAAVFDRLDIVNTSFALLFLSKGRSPVLISKLAYGAFNEPERGVIVEKGVKGITGWNRKHNDARHLTEFCARELFKGVPLGWQVYDPRRVSLGNEATILAEVGVLVQSPILYITGHEAPVLTGQQKSLLKKYVEEGGFVVAEACCGSKDFADGFRKLIADEFEGTKLLPVPPEHAIWRAHFAVPPNEFPKLEYLQRGCRTVMILSPEPLAGFWEQAKFMPKPGERVANNRGEQAFRLGANIVAYATGMEPPKQRLTTRKIESSKNDANAPPKGFIKPAQIKLDNGEAPPAPTAMRNLMAYVRDVAGLDVVLSTEQLSPYEDALVKYKFMYMHGKKGFDWNATGIENVKINLQMGGLLLADACCGSEKFDTAFRALIERMFEKEKLKLVPIPVDDPLFSAQLNGGVAIKTVKRREKVAAAAGGNDAGFEELPPRLEGIKLDGRWVVIYSKYDLGCALENHKSSDCLGHTPESAKRLAAAAVLYSLKRGINLK